MNALYTKYDMRQAALNGVITVHFVKRDGTDRRMVCTLLPEYITDDRQLLQENTITRAENPNTLSVWDIEANGWRSFNIDSITRVEF